MAEYNPSILGQVGRPTVEFDPIGIAQKSLQLRQQQMQLQGQQRLRDLAGSVDITTPEGQNALIRAQAVSGNITGAFQSQDILAQAEQRRQAAAKSLQLTMQNIAEGSRKHIADSAQRAGAKAKTALLDPTPDGQRQALADIAQMTLADAQPREADDPATATAKEHLRQQWAGTLQKLPVMSPQELAFTLNQTAASGRTFEDWQKLEEKQAELNKPLSDLGKLAADAKAGRITPAEYEDRKRKMDHITPVSVSIGGVGAPGGLSQDAVDILAQQWITSGQQPNFGMGRQGAALKVAVANRMAEMGKEQGGVDLTSVKAGNLADTASLKHLQQQRDQMVTFENTALKNLDQFMTLAQKMPDSGSPWLNTPIRALASGAYGSEAQAAAKTALTVVRPEFAKINQGALQGVLSDSARHEVEATMPDNATLGQFLAAAKVLKQDAANRHQAFDAQISEIKGRIGGKKGATKETAIAVTDEASYNAVPSGSYYKAKDGTIGRKP